MQQKKAKCKQCGEKSNVEDTLLINLKRFCDYSCATQFGKDNIDKGKKVAAKEYNKATAELKKTFGLNGSANTERRTRIRATTEACHLYIRTRDKGKPCPCCGLPLGDDYHAGHFKRSNSFGAIKFDEDNIHGQRADCNTRYGGDRGEYEYNLRKRIGDERVNALYEKIQGNNRVYKYTIDELKDIENYYKEKIKLITNKC